MPVTMAVSSLSCVRLSIRGCDTNAPSDCKGKMLCSTRFVSRSTARLDGLPRPAIDFVSKINRGKCLGNAFVFQKNLIEKAYTV